MHPSTIKEIQGRVYGGINSGLRVSIKPNKLSDISAFLKEASAFVGSNQARLIELTMINHAGFTELHRMYSEQEKALATPTTRAVETCFDYAGFLP